MQKLQTVNAETLLYEPLEKPSFVVDSLIPTGLSLFCGSQKIGKSWLMLKLCLCVSQGIPLWDMTTMAVSYTHLDVYKRQERQLRDQGCALGGKGKLLSSCLRFQCLRAGRKADDRRFSRSDDCNAGGYGC